MDFYCCLINKWRHLFQAHTRARIKGNKSVMSQQASHCRFFPLGTASLCSQAPWQSLLFTYGSGPPSLALTETHSVTLQDSLLSKKRSHSSGPLCGFCCHLLWRISAASYEKIKTSYLFCPTFLFSRCLLSTRLRATVALYRSSPSQVPPTHLKEKCECNFTTF